MQVQCSGSSAAAFGVRVPGVSIVGPWLVVTGSLFHVALQPGPIRDLKFSMFFLLILLRTSVAASVMVHVETARVGVAWGPMLKFANGRGDLNTDRW